ncbi:MAG: 2-dehydro-3-deoxygalactonokinase [Planctomycetia bacterium]|nr:2-dehydro-3-deoxygalactonokinase [Planctomycetia bacterium]
MSGLIGLDWGTSSLRSYRFGPDGTILERCARPWGIQHLPEGGYEAAFRGVAGEWLQQWPDAPVIAGGMVGSRQGWREVPYVECPADPLEIARGMVALETALGTAHLVPGLLQRGAFPDVMRGEEVQIVGALAGDPSLAAHSLMVLPGTHCKWATIRDGKVTGFTTYLTGELFAMLRDHSIIGRPARDAAPGSAAAFDKDAFLRGVQTARDSGSRGIAGLLFTTRSLFLLGELPVGQTLDYLSGLLVGEELRCVLAGGGDIQAAALVLIGDATLCERHRLALAAYGIDNVRVANETGPAGLWRIAEAAGLVTRSA